MWLMISLIFALAGELLSAEIANVGADSLQKSGNLSEQKSTELPPIEVKAKRPRRTPTQPSEYTGEHWDLGGRENGSLSNSLKRSSALQVREQGGEGNTPLVGVRGQDPIQTRYFLEGVPLSDAEFNGGMVQFLPFEALSGMDLYPEGIPARYGEDGLGGAIHLNLAGLSQPQSIFGTRFGSYRFANVFGSANALRANWHLDYRQSQEDFAYFDDNGTPFNPNDNQIVSRENNDFQRVTLLPQWTLYEANQTKLTLFSLGTWNRTGIPGAISSPTRAKLTQRFSLTGLHYEDADTDAIFYLRGSQDDLTNRSPDQGVAPPSYSRALALGLRATERFGPIRFTSGFSVDDFVSEQLLTQERKANQRWAVPFGGTWEMKGNTWSVTPGVLGHYYFYHLQSAGSLQAVGLSSPYRYYVLFSPRIGAKFHLSESWQIRSSLGSYYRAPTLFELYGAPFGITAATQLSPERAEKAEVGFDWEQKSLWGFLRRFRVSYTGGISRARNLISYVQSSAATRTAVNVGESFIHFHELAAEGRSIESPWWGQMSFTWMGTTNLSEVSYQYGKQLPNRPNYRGELHLGYEREKWRAGYRFSLSGPTFWDLGNFKKMSSVSEHGAYLGLLTKSLGEFGIEGRNLFDTISTASQMSGFEVVDNTTGYWGYPKPGRRVYFTWQISL